MAEVGSAFVSILPSAKGFGGQLDSEVSPQIEASGKKAGSRFGSALKTGAKRVAQAAGAVLGVALFKGFQRLSQIEEARAKLTGLGHTTKTVDQIMGNALASVKGTAFGLGEAGTVAAAAVAAGVKPGKKLESTLKLVADAATIGGTSMGEMGLIFNKVAASNKVQGDVINQLNERGIPIVQLLGKSMGKTSEQVLALSKKGKIGFAEFSTAMEQGLGGAALESGNTFTGAWKNMMASLGRIGANLMSGIFPQLAPGLKGITSAMAPLEDGAKKIGEAIGKKLVPAVANIVPKIKSFAASAGSFDAGNLTNGASGIGEAFGKIGAAIGKIDWSAVKDSLGEGVVDTINVFAVVIGFAADHVDTLAKHLPMLVAAFVAYKVAQAASNVVGLAGIPIQAASVVANLALARANRQLAAQMALTNTVEKVGLVTRARGVVVAVASAVAQRTAAAATRVWAAGQWLLNAAMTANPIGLVIAAIVALVAGFVIAYKKSETFRKIVDTALRAVGTAGKWMWTVLKPAFSAIVAYIKVMGKVYTWLWNNAARPALLAIAKAIGTVMKVWAAMLRALSRVPGFGWAKTAAKVMDGAADKALNLGDHIKKIPNRKDVKVTADTSGATAALNNWIRLSSGKRIRIGVQVASGIGANAAGTDNWRGGLTWVGEKGPEILNLPRGSQIIPNHQTASYLREHQGSARAAGGGAAVTQNIYTSDPMRAAREAQRQLAWAGAV